MDCYIRDHLPELKERHYIRKADANRDYWFDFSAGPLRKRLDQFGPSLCLVINGSVEINDAYIVPFGAIADSLKSEFLYENRRWIGSIRENRLSIRKSGLSLSVSEFYNAFELFQELGHAENRLYDGPIPTEDQIQADDLAARLANLNTQFQGATPLQQRRISERVARPGLITDYLKALRGYKCQLCGQDGFRQTNGLLYAEAHHLIELHSLITGSLCTDNIIIVCANCHRKLHYARVEIISEVAGAINCLINGEPCSLYRNLL